MRTILNFLMVYSLRGINILVPSNPRRIASIWLLSEATIIDCLATMQAYYI